MTVIRPNSVSGINSITAQANEIKIFKSDGTQGGLVIGGANLNATSGISTVAALTVNLQRVCWWYINISGRN